jgi:hypothetical protein
MPLNDPSPNFALLTSLDLRDHSNTTIFTRAGGSDVVMPTFATNDAGIYEDTLFFLNNRGTDGSLNAVEQIDSDATFGATWNISINSSDKVQITSNVDFTVTSTGTTDALGFSSIINATLVGSDYVATAPTDWTRGILSLEDITYQIDEVGGAGTFNYPSVQADVQDVPSWIREPSASDVDNFNLSSLQELDNNAQSSSNITWILTNDGFTQCYYTTTLGDITWSNITIRDLLGFTGSESPVVDGTVSRLTSTRKPSGVLLPTRPYQQHHLRVENLSQSRRKIGGGYVSNYIGTYITSILLFDLDALLDSQDDYRHFTNEFIPLVSGGERLNFYQDFGDSRRALITADVNSSQSAYDLVYTSEDNGSYGRVRGSLITTDYNLSYPTRLRRRVPVTMEIEHL